jgi:hypothetical protein
MHDLGDDGWHYVGKHSIRFEPPDILFSRPDGDMSVNDVRQIMAFIKSLPKPEKGFFSLIDVSRGGRQDPAVLKLPDMNDHVHYHRMAIYFNAKFHHRTLAGVFLRAARILKMPGSDVEQAFFDTEAEARAWIEAKRNAPDKP